MEARDLMVGDWVVYNGDVDYINPIKIEGMDIATGMCVTTDRDDVGFDGVWPIPLTAEILEKNGFEKCRIKEIEYFGWRLNEDFSLELNAVDTLMWNDDVAIHYVHQLQHALRLCGIDKEIIL